MAIGRIALIKAWQKCWLKIHTESDDASIFERSSPIKEEEGDELRSSAFTNQERVERLTSFLEKENYGSGMSWNKKISSTFHIFINGGLKVA